MTVCDLIDDMLDFDLTRLTCIYLVYFCESVFDSSKPTKRNMKLEHFPEVNSWIESLTEPIPLKAVENETSQASLQAVIDNRREIRGTRLEAVLWLRIGMIDRPHELVQHGSNAMDCYLHGVVHRLEGDFWNSKYWFRQIIDKSLLESISSEVTTQLIGLNEIEAARHLEIVDDCCKFSASHLVDACEGLNQGNHKNELKFSLLQLVCSFEWKALLERCFLD